MMIQHEEPKVFTYFRLSHMVGADAGCTLTNMM